MVVPESDAGSREPLRTESKKLLLMTSASGQHDKVWTGLTRNPRGPTCCAVYGEVALGQAEGPDSPGDGRSRVFLIFSTRFLIQTSPSKGKPNIGPSRFLNSVLSPILQSVLRSDRETNIEILPRSPHPRLPRLKQSWGVRPPKPPDSNAGVEHTQDQACHIPDGDMRTAFALLLAATAAAVPVAVSPATAQPVDLHPRSYADGSRGEQHSDTLFWCFSVFEFIGIALILSLSFGACVCFNKRNKNNQHRDTTAATRGGGPGASVQTRRQQQSQAQQIQRPIRTTPAAPRQTTGNRTRRRESSLDPYPVSNEFQLGVLGDQNRNASETNTRQPGRVHSADGNKDEYTVYPPPPPYSPTAPPRAIHKDTANPPPPFEA